MKLKVSTCDDVRLPEDKLPNDTDNEPDSKGMSLSAGHPASETAGDQLMRAPPRSSRRANLRLNP